MENLVLKLPLLNTPRLSLTYFLALRRFWALSLLTSMVFASAIGVVYVKAMNRMLYSDLQVLQKSTTHYNVEWGQLLLEQSTWATPARVQDIAEERLNMAVPERSKVIMVEE